MLIENEKNRMHTLTTYWGNRKYYLYEATYASSKLSFWKNGAYFFKAHFSLIDFNIKLWYMNFVLSKCFTQNQLVIIHIGHLQKIIYIDMQ